MSTLLSHFILFILIILIFLTRHTLKLKYELFIYYWHSINKLSTFNQQVHINFIIFYFNRSWLMSDRCIIFKISSASNGSSWNVTININKFIYIITIVKRNVNYWCDRYSRLFDQVKEKLQPAFGKTKIWPLKNHAYMATSFLLTTKYFYLSFLNIHAQWH